MKPYGEIHLAYFHLFSHRLDPYNDVREYTRIIGKCRIAAQRYVVGPPPAQARLPRIRWRQKESHKLPFYLYEIPTNLGYLTSGIYTHYWLNQYQGVLWNRKRGKKITRAYLKHLCKEMGYYLA